jgi:acyl carrier protein
MYNIRMDQTESRIEHRIEEFIRMQFGISPTDPMFNRQVDLFEAGYVDSMGIVELLEFLRGEFSVEIPDDDLLADDFSNIAGIARIVTRHPTSQIGASRMAQEAPHAAEA